MNPVSYKTGGVKKRPAGFRNKNIAKTSASVYDEGRIEKEQ